MEVLRNELMAAAGRKLPRRLQYDRSPLLLCLDEVGDVVVVELKRDKTPREITAQALDYGSWVKDLSHERIATIAGDYFRDMNLRPRLG